MWAGRRKFPIRYFTFFGLQTFDFFAVTNPQSLQRKSPGLALRIGLPFWHDMAVPDAEMATTFDDTILL
jgi:hypothetical protein